MSEDDLAPARGDSDDGFDLPPSGVEGIPASGGLRAGVTVKDRFRLDELLGRGGMGSVWLAHDVSLDIDVAMKVIRPDVAEKFRRQSSERLLQEARAAAKLVHPAIVRITDYGTTEAGDPFIVMERLDGIDLCTALETQPHVSPERAVRTLLPILSALKYAHARGILHRDIKPENIFVTRTDEGSVQPKLIDFGIARQQPGDDPPSTHRITQPGAVMGSPGYMAPEQARGNDADHRADLWSLCVVLYELVVGELPFEGRNNLALMRAIIEGEPTSFADLRVGEDELWTIVQKGLAKSPDDRWQNAEELAVELASWLWRRGFEDDICGSSLTTTWLQERPSLSPEDVLLEDPPSPRSSGWHFEAYRRRPTPSFRSRSTPPASSPTPPSTPVPQLPGRAVATDPSPGVEAPSEFSSSQLDPVTLPAAKPTLPLVGVAVVSALLGVVGAGVLLHGASSGDGSRATGHGPSATAVAAQPETTGSLASPSAPHEPSAHPRPSAPLPPSAGPSAPSAPPPPSTPPPRTQAPPPPRPVALPPAAPAPPAPDPAPTPPPPGDLMKPTF